MDKDVAAALNIMYKFPRLLLAVCFFLMLYVLAAVPRSFASHYHVLHHGDTLSEGAGTGFGVLRSKFN